MTRVDCRVCGAALEVPLDVEVGERFRCGRCSALLRNDSWHRTFRWAALPPYVRKHGVSRGGRIAALAGASIWLVVLAVSMGLADRFEPGLLFALALPYAVVLFVLDRFSRRRPPELVGAELMIALGVYLGYVFVLVRLRPAWRSLLDGFSTGVSDAWLLGSSVGAVITGLVIRALLRFRAEGFLAAEMVEDDERGDGDGDAAPRR